MISVIATVTTKANQREAFVSALKELMPRVHAEAGCVEYAPVVDVDAGLELQDGPRENIVIVLEKWESLDALKVHLDAPHMHEFREKVGDIVESLTLQVAQPA